ncbi:MAG TPA: hypothetical protein VIU11_14370 [Nakamurella sp.]
MTAWELAPDDLDDLPRGTELPSIPIEDAPQGVRNVAKRIDPGWTWRLQPGEGWAIRQAYGPPRGDGTRPQLRTLQACDTISIRAEAEDPAFPAIRHHVAIVWCRIEHTGKRGPDGAWAWQCEPHPQGGVVDGVARRAWSLPPRRLGLAVCSELLAVPPDGVALQDAYVAAGPPVDGPDDV